MKTKLLKLKQNNVIKVNEDIQYVLDFPEFDMAKEYLVELQFEKPGITAEILGIYRLKNDQRLNLTTIAHHKAPNTTCTTNIKGVLYDNSGSNYVGKILIKKKAQQTSSYLDDSILVIGEKTKNSSQPILEIEADDVKASHGATTGRISPEMVYYLQSRGFSKKEAEEMVVEGFFESVISTINDDKIRMEVKKSLNA